MSLNIKCPNCGKIFVIADSPNVNNLIFACPICKTKSKVGDCKQVVKQQQPKVINTEEKTQYGKPQGNGYNQQSADETVLPGTNGQANPSSPPTPPTIGRLVDQFGTEYKLAMGTNTIGRKAMSSTANVQINTSDRYMSRSHAVVDVKMAGGKIIHILHNGANKNPSFHNGNLVGEYDQSILNNGDRLKFGNTELSFKL